jgi:HAD superfamily hydrolase (TIGR01509 family)
LLPVGAGLSGQGLRRANPLCAAPASLFHNVGVAVPAVIFDFDGLLMDTESTSLASWQYEWRQHGLELDVSTFFADHGGDVTEDRYAKLAQAVGPSFAREVSHARRTAYRERLHRTLGLATGIRDWLEQAAPLGIRLAVASSSPRSWVHGHLSRADVLSRFEVLACGDEVSEPKPDPAVYELALHRLGRPAAGVVAVEDSAHGVAAAQAAGLKCVAIPNPHADPGQFGAADLLLASAAHATLAEVLAAVGGWPSL